MSEATPDVSSESFRLVRRKTGELRPHPLYAKIRGPISPSSMVAMKARAEEILKEPLRVTAEGTILDGYARWQLARSLGRKTLLCHECQVQDEEQVVQILLDKHLHRSEALSRFSLVLLANHLEPTLRDRAQANRRLGRGRKLWSNMTGAQRTHVRDEIARLAGVSTGTVTKAQRILQCACPEVLRALCAGTVSIHRAYGWRDLPHREQQSRLKGLHAGKDNKQQIGARLRQHRQSQPQQTTLNELIARLQQARDGALDLDVCVLRGGKGRIFVTPDLVADPAPRRSVSERRGQ